VSSLATILEDAERIAPDLVPSAADLGRVVGVVVQHLEAAAGHELPKLADELLGIPPPEGATEAATEAAQGAVTAGTVASKSPADRIAELKAEAAAVEAAQPLAPTDAEAKEIADLEAKVMAGRGSVQTPQAGAPGSGVTETGATP
jgi:hypothetical protein